MNKNDDIYESYTDNDGCIFEGKKCRHTGKLLVCNGCLHFMIIEGNFVDYDCKFEGVDKPFNIDDIIRPINIDDVVGLKRLPKGEKMPQKEFSIPILKALVGLGGKGRVSDILQILEKMLGIKFRSVDYENTPSGAELRWENTAKWERKNLVIKGLLRSDSHKGIWEITDKGRRFLEENRVKQEK